MALAWVQSGVVSAGDFARASSDAASFTGWVAAMKKHFHDRFSVAPPAPATAPKVSKAATPPAPPPKPQPRKS